MRTVGFVVGALLLASEPIGSAVAADVDPATIAAAERLQRDMQSDKISGIVLSVLRGPMVGLLATQGQNRQAAEQTYDELLAPAIQLHLPELRHEIAVLYAARMSAAELDACDAFYRSPTGRKLVATQTDVMAGSGPLINAWARKVAGEVIQEKRQALQQRGVSL